MNHEFEAPGFNKRRFHCPVCHCLAQVEWEELRSLTRELVKEKPYRAVKGSSGFDIEEIHPLPKVYMATSACDHYSVWLEIEDPEYPDEPWIAVMLHPKTGLGPEAHDDMPADIKSDYQEARSIAQDSPRGAAALLRLCIQKLCVELGEKGKNLNDDIGQLVKKGLPPQVQKALDVVRVIGNEAVHPGTIQPQGVEKHVGMLFVLVNRIVEEMIRRPRDMEALYLGLPKEKLESIESRDKS